MRLPNKLYDILKWVALFVFPAVALFINTIGPVWNMPNVDAIVTTLNALGVLVATIIGLSTLNYNKDK